MIITMDIAKISLHGLTPNEYCFLWDLFRGVSPTIPEDNVNMDILQNNGWIKKDVETDKWILLGKFRNAFSDVKIIVMDDFITEWINLWPSGIKGAGGFIKSNKKDVTKKMVKFVNENPHYPKNKILEATKLYIDDQRRKGYKYCMLAHYFIYKDNISALASYIDNLDAREEEYRNIKHI